MDKADTLISALLSSLLPGDGDWPSAAATGLPAWFGRRIDASPALADAIGWLRTVLPTDFAIRAPSLREVDLKGCEAADPARFAVVVTEAVSGYYIDPAVLSVVEAKTGFPARPPQPMGHRLEPFDFSILEGRKRSASDR